MAKAVEEVDKKYFEPMAKSFKVIPKAVVALIK